MATMNALLNALMAKSAEDRNKNIGGGDSVKPSTAPKETPKTPKMAKRTLLDRFGTMSQPISTDCKLEPSAADGRKEPVVIQAIPEIVKDSSESKENGSSVKASLIEDYDTSVLSERRMPPETLLFGNGQKIQVYSGSRGGSWKATERCLLNPKALDSWVLIHQKRDEELIDRFWKRLREQGGKIGMSVSAPQICTLDAINATSVSEAIAKAVSESTKLITVVLHQQDTEVYKTIKKTCSLEKHIPSEIVLSRTLEKFENSVKPEKTEPSEKPDKLEETETSEKPEDTETSKKPETPKEPEKTSKKREKPEKALTPREKQELEDLSSVVQKIALQVTAKLGGELWGCRAPLRSSIVIGVATWKDGTKSDSDETMAAVATMNACYSKFFSQATNISDGSLQNRTKGFRILVAKCLDRFRQVKGVLPSSVVIFRLMPNHAIPDEEEAKSLVTQLKAEFDPEMDTKMTFVAVLRNSPKAREVYRKTVDTAKKSEGALVLYSDTDCFIYSKAKPTHYIPLLMQDATVTPTMLHAIIHKLCHMYYNQECIVAVPAPCQYAQKYARMVGEHLLTTPNDISFEEKLFYL